MIPATCEFEPEVLAAALESRWPEGADTQLREHAFRCAVCSETALIAAAIANDRDLMRPDIVIPDSGRVWYLAQLRALYWPSPLRFTSLSFTTARLFRVRKPAQGERSSLAFPPGDGAHYHQSCISFPGLIMPRPRRRKPTRAAVAVFADPRTWTERWAPFTWGSECVR